MAKSISEKQALAAAKAVDRAGNWEQAAVSYEAILARTPHSAAAHAAYGAALARRRRPEAEAHLRRAVELNPGRSKLQVELARYLREVGRFDEASTILEAVLVTEPDNLAAISVLAPVREAQDDLNGAFSLYHRAIQLAPDRAKLYGVFAEFLTRQAQNVAHNAAQIDPESGKLAAIHGLALSRVGRYDEAAGEFERAAQLDPQVVDLRRELAAIKHLKDAGEVRHRRPAPWPTRDFHFDDYEKLIRRYLLREVPENLNLLTKETKVATMGSCFATHVAERLQARGVDCFYKLIAEDINSTYANRYLLDWIVDGATDDQTARFEELYGTEERLDFERNLGACELFIFSLGLATSFFERDTGKFVLGVGGDVEGAALAELYQHRNTSLKENVVNVRRMIDQLRRLNPGVKVVLTVSPVPLGGTYERRSAILADCVSKSTLRLTVEEILAQGLEDIYYWPSFEMVRWLGAHLTGKYTPPFAADDGRTRHVSVWLQDLIIRLFIEYFGDESMAQSAEGGKSEDAQDPETLLDLSTGARAASP